MSEDVQSILDSLIEELAAIEHDRWAHWQQYMHEHADRQANGSLIIPKHLVERWDRQIATSYEQLTDKEKESDREQVRKYLSIIISALSREKN